MRVINSGILAVGVLFSTTALYADTPAHARVGTLEYTEGAVFLNGQALSAEKSGSQVVNRGGSLKTADGHAEMLLTPGIYLRLGHNSSALLENDSLTDTRVRLQQGSAMLEVDNLHKENRIAMDVGDASVRVKKNGLYRFDTNPPAVDVIKGKVEATAGSLRRTAGKNHQIALAAELQSAKFKEDKNAELDRWSRLRSEYEAEANVGAAQYAYDMGWGWGYPGWFWNPWFSTWTWLPWRSWYLNPYGFVYWSPVVVYHAFPERYYGIRHVHFAPVPRGSSPSGLNLERTPAVRSLVGRGWFRPETGEFRGRGEQMMREPSMDRTWARPGMGEFRGGEGMMRGPSMGRMSGPHGRGR
jgi:hypothetical protein